MTDYSPGELARDDKIDAAAELRRQKYGQLPPLVRIEDTITSQECGPVRDGDGKQQLKRQSLAWQLGFLTTDLY
jgi:hypothetical protein